MEANKLSGYLKSFLSRTGKILVSQERNALIVTDLPSNIKTIKKLITELDANDNKKMEFVKLKILKLPKVILKLKVLQPHFSIKKFTKKK